MSWLLLILAGLFEIAWPVGLKLSQEPAHRISGIILAIVGMTISGWLLWMAQKNIPIGTAYAIWTGIGAAGTFLVGVYFFGDNGSIIRFLGVALIVLGVVTLKVGS